MIIFPFVLLLLHSYTLPVVLPNETMGYERHAMDLLSHSIVEHGPTPTSTLTCH